MTNQTDVDADAKIDAAMTQALESIGSLIAAILTSGRTSRFSEVLRISKIGILLQREARQSIDDLDAKHEDIALEGIERADGLADFVDGQAGPIFVGAQRPGNLLAPIVPDQHQLYRELMAMIRPFVERTENENKRVGEQRSLFEMDELVSIAKLLAELPENDPLRPNLVARREKLHNAVTERCLHDA